MPSPASSTASATRFADPSSARQALTHRSHGATHNERLEFVGDAVLNCVVAPRCSSAFRTFPKASSSRVRASLVNRDTLARLARGLGAGRRDPARREAR